MPTLTIFETLLFHAQLKLDLNLNLKKKKKIVEQIITILGLQTCSNILVGSSELKGVSGGEKRRLSIGIQLIVDPAVCLFDEPTTGLF